MLTQAELDALISRARKPLALELTVSDWEAVAAGATSYRGLPIFLTERRSRVVTGAAQRTLGRCIGVARRAGSTSSTAVCPFGW